MSRLELKIVGALLLIAVIPLAASVVLVNEVIRAADRVTASEIARLHRHLEDGAAAYRAFFAERKRVFRLQADLIARDAALFLAATRGDAVALRARLEDLARQTPALARAEVRCPGGVRAAFAAPQADGRDRPLTLSVQRALGPGCELRLAFTTSREPYRRFVAMGEAQRSARALSSLRGPLRGVYVTAFVVAFGAVLIGATTLGLLIARRTTRRIAALALATRRVAAGDLDVRVGLTVRDEIGELARAFDEMVRRLAESRERIAYLEKIGAWQEVARRLAHEIKNPLTPIQLAAQQMRERYAGDDPAYRTLVHEAAAIIEEEVAGLRRLVQSFSAFARLPAARREPIDAADVVDDLLRHHAELRERASIAWTRPATPAPVAGDRMLLRHVLYNVVENAIEAAEEAGRARPRIEISARTDPGAGEVVIAVADDGPGVPPDVAERLFDPYVTTRARGSGLGLAIVKKIVLEHEGRVAVSPRPGGGTRLTIALPLAPP